MFKLIEILTKLCKVPVLAMIVVTLVACGQKLESNNFKAIKGTSDGGGGLIEGSTKEEVRESIFRTKSVIASKIEFSHMVSEAIEFIGKDEFNDNGLKEVIVDIYNLQNKRLQDELQASSDRIDKLQIEEQKVYDQYVIADDSGNYDKADQLFDEHLAISDEILDAINLNLTLINKVISGFEGFLNEVKLEIKVEGPCTSKNKTSADASVSENNFNASICFSLEKLSRIPKESLDEHIAGLWFHELAHMAGADEEISVQLEKITINSYKKIVSNKPFYDNVIEDLHHNQMLVGNLTSLLFGSINRVRNHYDMPGSPSRDYYVKDAYLMLGQVNAAFIEFIELFNKVVVVQVDKVNKVTFTKNVNEYLALTLELQGDIRRLQGNQDIFSDEEYHKYKKVLEKHRVFQRSFMDILTEISSW